MGLFRGFQIMNKIILNRRTLNSIYLNNNTVIAIIILFSCVLLYRYSNFVYINVIKYIIYFIISILLCIWGIKKYKIIINPITAYSLFYFIFSYSFLNIFKFQERISNFTEVIINLGTISFLLPYLIKVPTIHFKKISFKFLTSKSYYEYIFSLSLIIFIIEIIINKKLPLLETFRGADSYNNFKLLPVAHYIVMAASLIPGLGQYLYSKKMIKKSEMLRNSIIAIFEILNLQSRQLLLLVVICYLLSMCSIIKNKKRLNTIIITFILLFIMLFIIIGNVRVGVITSHNIKDYLVAFGGINENNSLNLIEIWFSIYGAKNIYTFNNMIQENYEYTYGIFTFKPIISFLLLDRIGLIDYDSNLDGFNRLATIIWDPYIDFGIIGVIVLMFFYGYLSKNIFQKYRKNIEFISIVKYSMIIFSLIMASFTNFFNTLFFWLVIISVSLIKDTDNQY